MYLIDQQNLGWTLIIDYPEPIINLVEAAQAARKNVYKRRRGSAFNDEASQIQAKHGSRISGLLSKSLSHKKAKSNPAQFTLDL